jgi:putative transposase
MPLWQRGFYEHIIRNEAELAGMREYIISNPARWDEDENNPDVMDHEGTGGNHPA